MVEELGSLTVTYVSLVTSIHFYLNGRTEMHTRPVTDAHHYISSINAANEL